MAINFSKLFHHTPVQTQKAQSQSLNVLKEATSQLMNKLQDVKQSAEKLDNSEVGPGSKTDKCFKKLNRECNRIVVSGKKLEEKSLMRDYNAIAHDTLKMNSNLNQFIQSTPMSQADRTELKNLRNVVGSAIQSHTSTRAGNGINLNGVNEDIARFKSQHR